MLTAAVLVLLKLLLSLLAVIGIAWVGVKAIANIDDGWDL